MALTGSACLMEPRSIGTVVPGWTAGLLACINECSFWRSQNDRRGRFVRLKLWRAVKWSSSAARRARRHPTISRAGREACGPRTHCQPDQPRRHSQSAEDSHVSASKAQPVIRSTFLPAGRPPPQPALQGRLASAQFLRPTASWVNVKTGASPAASPFLPGPGPSGSTSGAGLPPPTARTRRGSPGCRARASRPSP